MGGQGQAIFTLEEANDYIAKYNLQSPNLRHTSHHDVVTNLYFIKWEFKSENKIHIEDIQKKIIITI